MLLLIFAPQVIGPQPEFINLTNAMGDVIPQLNASGPNDLVFWSITDLYQWFDEAGMKLARTCGVFVERDTSLTSILDQGAYTLPADQISTIQVDLAGKVLKARTVRELEALDANWPSTVGVPVAFVQDTQGVTQLVIYPAPDAEDTGDTIGLTLHVAPVPIMVDGVFTPANAFLSAPQCVREYFTFTAIGEARAKESKMQMQEVAAWMRQLTGWMEQVFEGYWGEAQ